MALSNRRKYLRKKVKAHVVLRVKGAVEEDYKTYSSDNMSEEGVFLKTVDEYKPGTQVELHFSLPNSPQLLKVKGIIKWIQPFHKSTSTQPAGIGVEFSELDQEDQKIIHNFLESSL
ncbi:MAG: PilZ domain-containing protein [Deltaproteobacteria bacterium]|nr:PilZ domain-containing protein [Deltaproteobacteria bacterium]